MSDKVEPSAWLYKLTENDSWRVSQYLDRDRYYALDPLYNREQWEKLLKEQERKRS